MVLSGSAGGAFEAKVYLAVGGAPRAPAWALGKTILLRATALLREKGPPKAEGEEGRGGPAERLREHPQKREVCKIPTWRMWEFVSPKGSKDP